MTMTVNEKQGSRWWKAGLAVGLGLISLLVIVLLAFAGYLFFTYGEQADRMASTEASRVAIRAPDHGDTLTAGQPVLVEASATGPEPFDRMELWLNGELVGIQDSQDQGYPSWQTNFHWVPPETGMYQLVARAYSGEQTISSRGTLVQVMPPDIAGELMEDVPVGAAGPSVLPAPPADSAAGGSPAVEPAGTEAQPWNLRPGLWLQSFSTENSPAAPLIQADVDGCQVTLTIQDQADNEVGFLVLRQPVDVLAAEEVNSLAPQAGTGSFAFSHVSVPGTFSYFVRAFNSEGASSSNPALAEVDPADCEGGSQDEFTSRALQVHVENFQVDIATDRNYCYRSIDGANWSRWPLAGFMNGDNQPLFQLSMDELEDQPEEAEAALHLECWGWAGEELTFLGAISQHLGEEGSTSLSDGLLQVEVVQSLAEGTDGYRFYQMSGGGDFGPSNAEPFDFDDWLYTSLRMPRPFALVSYDPDACRDRLPPALQNNAGKLFACTPFPGFNVGPGGDNPQPYLLWFPGNACPMGQGTPPCIGYQDWLDEADAVGFEVYDKSGNQITIEEFDSPNWFVYNIKPKACQGTREFYVRMWAQINGQVIWGEPGPTVTMPCLLPSQGVTEVYVNFDQLRIMDASDGDIGPQDVEVYGSITISSSLEKYTLLLGQQSLTNGTYEMEGLNTCEKPCLNNLLTAGTSHLTTILVADGDKIEYVHSLSDHDTASADDAVCLHAGHFGPKTYLEWQDYQSSLWVGGLHPHPNGNCEVLLHLTGPNHAPGPQ